MRKLFLNKKSLIIIAAMIIVAAMIWTLIWLLFLRNKAEEKVIYKPIAEVLAEAPDALDNKYDNLILPESIDVDMPAAMHDIYLNLLENVPNREETIDRCIDMIKAFNGIDLTEDDVNVAEYQNGRYVEADYLSDIDTENPEDLDKEAFSLQYYNYGSFLLWNPYIIQNEIGLGLYANRKEYFEVGKDDLNNVIYSVGGQDYSAQQAVDYANSVVYGKLKDFIPYEVVEPKYVVVIDNELNDYYTFSVIYGYSIDGIELNMAGSTLPNEWYMQMSYLEVCISDVDKICQILNHITYTSAPMTDLEDKYITLEAALDSVNELLAQHFVHEITDIDIVYASPALKSDKEEGFILDFHPTWRFTTGDVSNSNIMPARNCIYVDMVTGAIVLYNDATGEFISNMNCEEFFQR